MYIIKDKKPDSIGNGLNNEHHNTPKEGNIRHREAKRQPKLEAVWMW